MDYFQLIHPKVVHFPIALFITALALDFASFVFKKEAFHKAALHIYVIAALITPLVVRSGIWEEERLHLKHPILDVHRMFGLWTMWIALMSLPILWLIKKEWSHYFRFIFFICLLGVASLVTVTGHNGGRMVYEYGVGVEE